MRSGIKVIAQRIVSGYNTGEWCESDALALAKAVLEEPDEKCSCGCGASKKEHCWNNSDWTENLPSFHERHK